MWTVIYIAPNKLIAEKYKTILTSEGMLVQLRPIGSAHLGEHASVEILVPESEAEEAHEIISSLAQWGVNYVQRYIQKKEVCYDSICSDAETWSLRCFSERANDK